MLPHSLASVLGGLHLFTLRSDWQLSASLWLPVTILTFPWPREGWGVPMHTFKSLCLLSTCVIESHGLPRWLLTVSSPVSECLSPQEAGRAVGGREALL